MSDTTYVDYNPPLVNAAWLNDVNNVNYRVLGSAGVVPNTTAQLLSNIGVYSKTDSDASATAIATSVAASTTQSGSVSYAIDTGTASTIVVALSPAPAALTPGMVIRVKVAASNTGASTLNVNGFGALPITDVSGNPIPSGTLIAGLDYVFLLNNSKSHWVLMPYYLSPIDTTSAASDVALAVGQSAKVSFSSQTVVPLHIACGDNQVFDMTLALLGNVGVNNSPVLAPNNTSYTNKIFSSFAGYLSGASPNSIFGGQWQNGPGLGVGDCIQSNCRISTATKSKTVIGASVGSNGTPAITQVIFGSVWSANALAWTQPNATDTTTPWSSLGTITFPATTSGTITVRRLA